LLPFAIEILLLGVPARPLGLNPFGYCAGTRMQGPGAG
jgi:hypothetical protein